MGRAKEAGAEALTAVADRAAAVVDKAVAEAEAGAAAAEKVVSSAADTILSGRAESIGTLSPTRRAPRLPGPARFALAVVLSFALSSLGRSFVDHCSDNEVGSITREGNSRAELAFLAAWRL
jgi:hypothetical protein